VGHLHILKWMKQRGYHWDGKVCSRAAYGGHLKVLKWAREQGCPWDEQAHSWAIWGGHKAVIDWGEQQGWPKAQERSEEGRVNMLEWAIRDFECLHVPRLEVPRVFQIAYHPGCPWTDTTCPQPYHRDYAHWDHRIFEMGWHVGHLKMGS